MKRTVLIVAVLALAAVFVTWGQPGPPTKAAERSKAANSTVPKERPDVKAKAKAFLDEYQKEYAELELKATTASWKAENTGKAEDFEASAAADLALRQLHSDPKRYKRIQALLKVKEQIDPIDARSLEVALLAFKSNQLPPEMLKEMVQRSSEIAQIFNVYRATLDGERYTNNDLLEMLSKENDTQKRRAIWEALKQVGGQVAPKLVELARLRNQAAKELGYDNYWDMQVRLQDYEPEQLLAIFSELEQMTNEPFKKMKSELDAELARRFEVKPEEIGPWHYDNPFFQAAPPSEDINLDEFYETKKKEEIVEIARVFFADIGLPIEGILARSDLYEREGKSQHAFCTSIDRSGDVRTLCNIKPTAEWMDTILHEEGHAVFDLGIDRSLPFNLREPAHIFATEGVAMLLGALGKNPTWMIGCAGADKQRVAEVEEAILEQRRREQLIFARWTLVMLNFEKALYEDPDRDLNALWWDYVERYQLVARPAGRTDSDWAAKPHFTSAPVYYHNYMLGELFAAQVRHVLAGLAGHEGPASTLNFNGRKEFGTFLKDKVFRPGASVPWRRFVEDVTGEQFTAKYFAEEVR